MRLKADLHVHSTYSDGRDRPEDIVVEAQRRGLNIIAITDHDTFEGGLRGYRFWKNSGLDVIVLVGAEIRTEHGDVLIICGGYGLQRIPRVVGELIDYAHANNCLAIPAHPFDKRRHGVGELVYHYDWDAIEVFNAMSDPLSNRQAQRAARELGLPGIASSDAHVVDVIGSAYTIVDSEPTVDDVLEAIRKGRVTPRPGRPTIHALVRTAMWSIERRLGLHDRKRMEKIARLGLELE